MEHAKNQSRRGQGGTAARKNTFPDDLLIYRQALYALNWVPLFSDDKNHEAALSSHELRASSCHHGQMKEVYISSKRPKRFHRTPYCPYSRAKELIPVSLDDLVMHPCAECFPDYPHFPDFVRDFCVECLSVRPCRHNGGEEITITMKTLTGRTTTTSRWVWPDSPQTLAKARRRE